MKFIRNVHESVLGYNKVLIPLPSKKTWSAHHIKKIVKSLVASTHFSLFLAGICNEAIKIMSGFFQ